MSEKTIPEHIDPYRLAEQKVRLDGILKINHMSRLCDSLSKHEGMVSVSMQFGVDEQGTTFLQGHLETQLELRCQRCMKPFLYEIISNFMLGVVNTIEEANTLPEQYELALTKEGSLALYELIEEELILNLPVIPKHEPEQCEVILPQADSSWNQQGEGENPFQVLESLKQKKQ